jgi:hypothetical protein
VVSNGVVRASLVKVSTSGRPTDFPITTAAVIPTITETMVITAPMIKVTRPRREGRVGNASVCMGQTVR